MLDRRLLVLAAFLLLAANAFAATPTVVVLGFDGNQYYPSGSTITVNFQVGDDDNALDANIWLYYLPMGYTNDGNAARHAIMDTIFDANSNTYCDLPLTDVNQVCTHTWTLQPGLDGNFLIDINVLDVTNADDLNDLSTSFAIDTNACDTNYRQSSGDVTLDTNCTGLGSTATIYYGTTRVRNCPDNYDAYTVPFSRTFGEFMVCWYSIDSLGNRESTQSAIFTADSDAYDIAVLTELALAGLILFAILGAFVLRKVDLTGEVMVALVVGAVVIAIAIYIFAVVL